MTNEPLGLVVDITANIEKFEQAIDEKFKPALTKAIEEVTESFIKSALGECVEIGEPSKPLNEKLAAAADRLPRFPKGGIVGAGVISRGEKVFGR